MQSLLQTVSDLAKQVMPGDLETSVSLLINDKPSTPVYTGALARDCDESRYGRGYGACLHAASHRELTEIADAQAETRWRDYVEKAVEHGALSSLSVPLPISEGIAGALNVYAQRPMPSTTTAARWPPVPVVVLPAFTQGDGASRISSAVAPTPGP